MIFPQSLKYMQWQVSNKFNSEYLFGVDLSNNLTEFWGSTSSDVRLCDAMFFMFLGELIRYFFD